MLKNDLYLTIYSKIMYFFLIGNTLIVVSILRVREYGSDKVDFQIIIKLGLWSLCLAMSLFFWRVWIARIFKIDNFLILPLFLVMSISTLYAPSLYYSLGAVFSMISVFFFLFLCGEMMQEKDIIYGVIVALFFVCIISIIMYYTSPDMSRMKEWVGSDLVLGSRMTGLTSTANSMGLAASFGLLLVFYYILFYSSKYNFLLYFMSIFLLVALIMSDSRTSIIALIVTLVSVYFLRINIYRLLSLCLIILLLSFVFLSIDVDSLFSAISRSGDANEIKTGTGRTHIWETAIHLIQERPLTGYGYASTTFILPTYAQEIGHIPSTTHNIALQILFSIGYPGLFLFFLIYITKFYYALKYNDSLKIAILVFILISGLTEPSVFRGVAGMSSLIFAMAMGMQYKSRNIKL